MKTLFLQRKKSGNYTITSYLDENWTLVATCKSPKELKQACNCLGHSTIIKSEYRLSQLKTKGINYNEKDALKAFDLQATKTNISLYFQ